MKADSHSDSLEPLSANDRWIDAALTEHARLGRDGADEELILRILRQTVDAPTRTSFSRPAFNWRTASVSLGAIAAAVALVLGAFSLDPVKNDRRHSDELRFIVHVSTPDLPEAVSAKTPPGPGPVVGDRREVAMELSLPSPVARVDLAMAQSNWFLESGFDPTFETLPRKGDRLEDLRITADRATRSAEGLSYEGEVLVEHAQFHIEAASVQVQRAGTTPDSSRVPLFAKRVRVVQKSPACVAEAETLRFDPVSGSIILTGVSRMETTTGSLDRFAPGDKLVLSSEGFTVENAPIERSASFPLQAP